jgi:hypothetical protein
VTTLYCVATPPCELCTANQRPCECDEDCCSGICQLPDSKPSKSYSDNGKGSKTKGTKDSKGTKGTKESLLGKCVCRSRGAACAKDAECCYGRCKQYRCVASRRSFVETFAPLSHGNAGVAAALGAGAAAVVLGVILAIGVARRRRRLAKIAAPAQVDYVVA